MWEVVGIREPEERLYEVLVRRRQATVADLVAELGTTRAPASRILSRLVDCGLATRLPGEPARYAAVMPDLAAATLIAAQEHRLKQLRAHAHRIAVELAGVVGNGHPAELIEVIEGAPNVRNTFIRLQREARTEMRVFDKPPYTAEQPEGNPDEYQILSHGQVRYRTLYDHDALNMPGRMAEIWNGIRHGEQARVAGSLPMKMALCDTRLALIPVAVAGPGVNQAAYLIQPSSLLDALSELFEVTWDRSVPLNQTRYSEADKRELSDDDRNLLGLLAGGSTDEAIARTLGWSIRTVHRHVHRIMSMVGAETRFQAGMEAKRRGWV